MVLTPPDRPPLCATATAQSATLGCVIRAGKATGGNATVTLKPSGRTVRLNATTKIRVPSARRVSFTVKVAAFAKARVRYRQRTVRGTARR